MTHSVTINTMPFSHSPVSTGEIDCDCEDLHRIVCCVCVYVNETKQHSGGVRGQESSRCVVFFSLRVCVCVSVNKCGMINVSTFKNCFSFNG